MTEKSPIRVEDTPSFSRCLVSLVGILSLTVFVAEAAPANVDYQKDIRNILSHHCYQCHGPDENTREADLRLDQESGAILEMGGGAISRETPLESELLKRIFTDDLDDLMPPPSANKSLSQEQKARLKQWISEGANWGKHWAYEPVIKPTVPEVAASSQRQQPIDQFIGRKLQNAEIPPSPKADRRTLVRRLYFDLIGLPPLPEDIQRFENDSSPLAYQRLIEELLHSQHYGEKMAMYWFDLVRFGNSCGIHADNEWHVNPYRNWVIRAFNDNMPFDQFTREQLAGDLLTYADRDTKIAATYNRLNLSTREGGSQAKEFIAKYMADRVRNVSGVWLASTFGCAECHDHKFDPLTTKEFYQFGSFFADIDQVGVYGGDFPPYLKLPKPDEQARLDDLSSGIERVKAKINANTDQFQKAFATWKEETEFKMTHAPSFGPWHSVGPFGADDFDAAHDNAFGPESDWSLEKTYGEAGLTWTQQPDWKDEETQPLKGENSATYLYRSIESKSSQEVTLYFGSDDGIVVWLNGEEQLNKKVLRGVKKDEEKITFEINQGTNDLLVKISNGGGGYGFIFRSDTKPAPDKILDILTAAEDERDEDQEQELRQYFRKTTPLLENERQELADLEKQKKALDATIEKTLATVSVEPAMTRVLPRGNWMDDSGEIVSPAVPSFLGGRFEPDAKRADRLDLAHWLVDRENPLTARVMVNRLWMLFFGEGLAKSVDDFGAQGSAPSHPELLDWLATQFIESGWDIKHVIRLIVSSETYQQSSARREELEEGDPFNRFLARQNRYRLDAEIVRDMVLHTAGLLNTKVGGYESSKPYQPAGYYRHLNFPKRQYVSDENPNQYRRGVYMHWQRQYLHPALKAFDAPTREECTAKRPRSNTPLAALVQMNDPTISEASRVLAEQILWGRSKTDQDRIKWLFERVLSRPPSKEEANVLEELINEQTANFEADHDGAKAFLSIGLSQPVAPPSPARLAAWTMACRTLLNTHEAILRP